jgi:hypothetical protein
MIALRIGTHSILCSAFIVALILTVSTPAYAPGTIYLDEILPRLKESPELVQEINRALKAARVRAKNIECLGGRFGGHWPHLAAMRALPYSCKIGSRVLSIQGEVLVYDDAGNSWDMNEDLPDDEQEKMFKKATNFVERNFKWTWEDNRDE